MQPAGWDAPLNARMVSLQKPAWAERRMTIDDARQRIQSAITQFRDHAAPMIDLVIGEVRSGLGHETANDLIAEFDLELRYGIAPTEFE